MATANAQTATVATKVVNSAAWRERSKAIAERDHLYATLERIEYDENDTNGVRIYRAPSRHIANRFYTVQYELATMTARCECIASQHGLPCGHVGAVLFEVECYEACVKTWLQATGRAK